MGVPTYSMESLLRDGCPFNGTHEEIEQWMAQKEQQKRAILQRILTALQWRVSNS